MIEPSLSPHPTPVTARGFCRACGEDHVLGEGRARGHARALMEALARTDRLDFETPDHRSDPRLRGERLWAAGGRMFGVLETVDKGGATVVLRGFSSLAGGLRWVRGWVPPLVDRSTRARVILRGEREIKQITRRLDRLEPGDPQRLALAEARRHRSRRLMEEILIAYRVRNPRGEERSVREAFAGEGGLPGGLGECCAPKLLTEAARRGLRPRGLVEFFWGGSPPSENRVAGRFYPPCTNRCQPLLGFLLCGAQP